jgi:hypothetical protein
MLLMVLRSGCLANAFSWKIWFFRLPRAHGVIMVRSEYWGFMMELCTCLLLRHLEMLLYLVGQYLSAYQ